MLAATSVCSSKHVTTQTSCHGHSGGRRTMAYVAHSSHSARSSSRGKTLIRSISTAAAARSW